MKKTIFLLALLVVSFSCKLNVYAQEYQVKELIPVDAVATVETDLFSYNDFTIQASSPDKGIVKFTSIVNKSDKKVPISINLLLFDENMFNIGYVTYCTSKDYDSNYRDYELGPKGSISFSINIAKKYFVEGNKIDNIKYISVLDENKYCHVGGYNNYAGLTIEQIKEGDVAANYSSRGISLDFLLFFKNKGVIIILVVIAVACLIFMINGLILNALYKRMFAATTPMAYIPILNNYVSVKLAFGDIISKVYLVILLASIPLSFVGVTILTVIANIFSVFSFFVVIIKLITKRYNLFYFEPSVGNAVGGNVGDTAVNVRNANANGSSTNFVSSEYMNNNSDSSSENVLSDDIVDLSYDNVSTDVDISTSILGNFNNNISNTNSNTNISAGGTLNGSFDNLEQKEENNSQNNESNSGESDLTKFFK